MARSLRDRPNESWIEALAGDGAQHADAVTELTSFLRGIVGRAVGRLLDPDSVRDLVQESLARILDGLGSFRGDAAFPTWAAAVATRVALTEVRRRRARASGSFDAVEEEVLQFVCPSTVQPDAAAERSQLHVALEHAIRTQLTDRQRLAIMAELRGVPTIEIATRMNTNQNALYKLTHDARRRLRAALEEAGFSVEHLQDRVTEMYG